MKVLQPVTRDRWQVTRTESRSAGLVTRHPSPVTCRAFTMVEVAISLAIIGIALVAIIGVLPLGMNVQRDNREATVINQDATVFIEAIRNGAPLIAPAEEGIHSVELANAMLYSSFTGKTIELPLDGRAYERHLKKLIAAKPNR